MKISLTILAVFIALLFVCVLFMGYSTEKVPCASLNGIQIFPKDHIWNVPIDTMPVDTRSADYVNRISSGGDTNYLNYYIGFPYNVVDNTVEKQYVAVRQPQYSDNVPFPIPDTPLIESLVDFHMFIVNTDEKYLYELYDAEQQWDGSWTASAGAVYDLQSYTLRGTKLPYWSVDAAGLPVTPGLLRYDEVAAGEINHALRFGVPQMGGSWVWPARAYSSDYPNDPTYPPAGQRFRLKASFDTSGYPPEARVILECLKKYGMMVADNGGQWTLAVVPDYRWNYDDIYSVYKTVHGYDFEAVNVTSLMINENSGQARIPPIVSATPASSV